MSAAFTPAQADAISRKLDLGGTDAHPTGDVLVVTAGAGSGKTRVLTERIARLIEAGATPASILAITFTRAAATEMRDRLSRMVSERRGLPEIRTLHSWCATFLRGNAEQVNRTPSFSIYDDIDQQDILRACMVDIGRSVPEKINVKIVLQRDAELRDRFVDRLRAGNALTYDQLERFASKVLHENDRVRSTWARRYRHILVDETQDLSELQAALVMDLARPAATIFAVGDEKQSIYSFRGALPEVMRKIASTGDEVVLAENFRSVTEVVSAGNLLAPGDCPRMCATRPSPGPGAFRIAVGDDEPHESGIVLDQLRSWHEQGGIAWKDMAILARTWGALEKLHADIVTAAIPHRYYGEAADDLWTSAEARAVVRLAGLTVNPADDNLAQLVAPLHDCRQLRITATRNRSTLLAMLGAEDERFTEIAGATSISTLKVLAGWVAASNDLSLTTRGRRYIEAAAFVDAMGIESFLEWWTDRGMLDRAKDQPDGVSMMTIHGAKGLEWQAVALVGADKMPGMARTEETRLEERRIMYVGVTRAKDRLLVTYPRTRDHNHNKGIITTSAPFVDDLMQLVQETV